MAIKKIYVENFRGIHKKNEIEIRPITIIFGANSSGKSTCLHALACLSQTTKIYNDARPLILDDERAYVHLGQFLDVSHSKNPKDTITLGVCAEIGDSQEFKGDVQFTFSFSEDQQKIVIDSIEYQNGTHDFSIVRSGNGFSLKTLIKGKQFSVEFDSLKKFTFDQSDLIGGILARKKGPDSKEYVSNWINILHTIGSQQLAVTECLNQTLYLGPFRVPPIRRYADTGAIPSEAGSMGEATLALLVNETIRERRVDRIEKISHWLDKLGLGKKLKVEKISAQDIFDLRITLNDEKDFSIADLGYGLSQIIPVLTQCSFCEPNSTLLFEQPEIHLHPKAMRELPDIFIETIKEKSCSIVIETHSHQVIHGFLQAIRAKRLNSDEFVIYKAARDGGETCLTRIEADENGETDENYDLGVTN